MRINKITMKGITRFADEVVLDLESIGPGLVALAGKNGAGKTTCLEAAFAGLHLEYPTRPGPLHQVCHGKDARIELEIHNGVPIRTVVAVDAVLKTPKTEAFMFNGNGGEPITDGKVGSFREAVIERFGSPRLMLSAALSCQNRRGEFLSLSKADRKDLLAEILDTAGLQDVATDARERAKALDAEIMQAQARVDGATEELNRSKYAVVDIAELRRKREHLETLIVDGRETLEGLREKHGRLKAELDALDETKTRFDQALEKEVAIVAQLGTVPGQRAKAAAKLDEVETILKNARIVAEAESARLPEYEEAEKALDGLRERERDLHTKRDAANELLGERQEKERADKERQSQLRRLRDQRVTLEKATEILPTVPCKGASEFAGCRFLVDAKQADEQLPGLLKQIAEFDSQVEGPAMDWGVQEAESLVRDATDEINAARTKLDNTAALAALAAPARLATERAKDAGTAYDRAEKEFFERTDEIDQWDHEKTVDWDQVRQIINELQTRLAGADTLRDQIEKLTDQGKTLKATVEKDETELAAAAREITAAEEREKRRAELEETLKEFGAKVRDLGDNLADWKLLERAFGRDGIQALEIDAAGPDLSRVTNDLLHACFGERFTITFVTQVPSRAGGMKEVFDVEVLDHERGREGSVDSLSGGEKTIISEAISLALATYVSKHSGHHFETIFRDETAGALDPDNADRYVLMLRKARELAGAHQVVFIAQQPEVYEQADAVLWIEDGRAEARE